MNEVIPGIYRLGLTLPHFMFIGNVNIYLLRGDDGYTLIDTGWNTEETYASLVAQLAEIGVSVKQINKILVTHIHPDHYGLARRLKQISGAAVYLHRLDLNLAEFRHLNANPLLRWNTDLLKLNGVPPAEEILMQQASVVIAKTFVAPFPPDVSLQGGETISTGVFNLEVVWTPGHSPGHVCFYEPAKKVLFSGDHVLPHVTPNIGLHPQSAANPLGDFLQSLQRIRDLDVELVLPGQEEPFHDLKDRIDALIAHHAERNASIIHELQTGPRTAFEIAARIPWRTDNSGSFAFDKLTPFDKRLALLETLAHLQALSVDGKVRRTVRHSLAYFESA